MYLPKWSFAPNILTFRIEVYVGNLLLEFSHGKIFHHEVLQLNNVGFLKILRTPIQYSFHYLLTPIRIPYPAGSLDVE